MPKCGVTTSDSRRIVGGDATYFLNPPFPPFGWNTVGDACISWRGGSATIENSAVRGKRSSFGQVAAMMQVKAALKGHERSCKGFRTPRIGKERFENCKPCQRLRKSPFHTCGGSGINFPRRLFFCLSSQLYTINNIRCAAVGNPRLGFLSSAV